MRGFLIGSILLSLTCTGCVGFRLAKHQDPNNWSIEGAVGVGVGSGMGQTGELQGGVHLQNVGTRYYQQPRGARIGASPSVN